MSTTPILDPSTEQPPPPITVTTQQEAYTAHSGNGSVGPVVAVLAVITILGAIAVMIGRLCSGRRIMGHGQYYDFEGWVETKFSSCLDGRVDPPRPPRVVVENSVSGGSSGAAQPEVPVETAQEAKEKAVPGQQNPQERTGS